MPSAFRADLLEGKRALITGGSSGLGLAMARAFVDHGAEVVLLSRSEERLRAAAEGLPARWHVADVRDEGALAEAAVAERARGGVDILVNAAAGNFPVPFEAMSANAWRSVVDIVLHGTASVTRAFQDQLLSKGRTAHAESGPSPCLLNIVAGYAWTGAPGVSHSGAAKAGVLDLTRSLAVEWAPWVRCNALSPGPIAATEGMRRLAEEAGLEEVVRRATPMGRFAAAQEVAQAALFLVSPAASYVTGACVVADGGQDARGPFGALWEAMAGATRP